MKTKTLLLTITLSCSLYLIAYSNEAETLPIALAEQLNEMGITDSSTVTIIKITVNNDGTTTYTLQLKDEENGVSTFDLVLVQ